MNVAPNTSTRKRIVAGPVLFTLAMVCALQAIGGEKLSISTGANLMSKYVWRGQLVNDEPVLQPAITFSYGDFSFGTWASMDLTDIAGSNERYHIQEVDYTLSYATSVTENMDLEVGGIVYAFPSAPDTAELYSGLTYSTPLVTPSITVYYDVEEAEGFYASIGVDRSFDLTEKVSLNVGASQGWGDSSYDNYYFGVNDAGLNDLSLHSALSYSPNETTTFSASVQYTSFVDSDISNVADAGGDAENVIVGVGGEWSF